MSYYLLHMSFKGGIPEKNVSKLTPEFLEEMDVEFNTSGDIIDIWRDDLKFNFEELIQENAKYFQPGSHFDMIGEDGCAFRWIFDGTSFKEVYGRTLFPTTENETKAVKALRELIEENLIT